MSSPSFSFSTPSLPPAAVVVAVVVVVVVVNEVSFLTHRQLAASSPNEALIYFWENPAHKNVGAVRCACIFCRLYAER